MTANAEVILEEKADTLIVPACRPMYSGCTMNTTRLPLSPLASRPRTSKW